MWTHDNADTAVPDTNNGFKIRQKYLIDTPATNGKFQLRLPLHMLFGFMENFTVLKGYTVEIELVRGPDYPALYRDNAAGDHRALEGKFTFSNFLLNIPVVKPSTAMEVKY